MHPGDHIWWDLHDWSQTDSVPAVVGSFPEPFLNGIEGKRLPVRIECAAISSDPCQTVSSRLRALGVPAALAALGPGDEPETLRVLVGPWTALRGDPAVARRSNSVPVRAASMRAFARPATMLTLLNEQGAVARTLHRRCWARSPPRATANRTPVWVVTGTDAAGVEEAAHAFDQATLARPLCAGARADGAPASRSLPVLAGIGPCTPGRCAMFAARSRSSTAASRAPCTPRARAWARSGRSR